ncbi:ubiquitin conjugation factor E4 A [Athalia rosae]|uniref:ubiquitin conjugation factor E4 A n=1 Tax=Athalia rosae TaxID=37344 RepID=UPI00203483B5|nr:ubiquitin conjugation factor E4 A [Athalia rosae]XP_012254970.2 ubiquitin conjugation factor E4 A [Athalia rosae]
MQIGENFTIMCENTNSNPFAGLFSTINEAASFPSLSQIAVDEGVETLRAEESKELKIPEDEALINDLVERVFGLTLHKDARELESGKNLVFLEDLASSLAPKNWLDAESVEHAIFDRLMLNDPSTKIISNTVGKDNGSFDSHFVQTEIVTYLFESYCRLTRYKHSDPRLSKTVDSIKRIIIRNLGTALQEPTLFQNQKIHEQFVALFMDGVGKELTSITAEIAAELSAEDRDDNSNGIGAAFAPILNNIHNEVAQSNILVFRQYWFGLIQTFASIESLAMCLISHSTPQLDEGRAYSDTLLGALLCLSCLPKTTEAPFDFFDKPLQQSVASAEGNIWTALDGLSISLHKVFHTLLKCSAEVRHKTLKWIADCLHANAGRGKIWNTDNDAWVSRSHTVSDGFMLNLSSVLLRLCQPFCSKLNDSKLLRIDPTYCSVEARNEEESRSRGLHARGMSGETCLIPTPEGESRPAAETFGFVTECFYLTHRALDLGYRVILEKLMRINQDLARMQRIYNDARGGGSSEVLESITVRMEMEMTKFLSFRASLLAPEMLGLVAKFHAMTAVWLLQVNLDCVDSDKDVQSTYAPKEFKTVTFPLPATIPKTLRCIPEFVVENAVGFLCFLRRLNPNAFEEQGPNFLNPILTEVIALMESQQRLYNPHLRARLAEGLEALLPSNDEAISQTVATLGTFHREQLFIIHPHRHQIVANLLQVFVGIEMTGQSVQFEQKFNYRRPMYIVMDYLWKIAEHRNNFKVLAEDAEDNMEAVQPPLFLRFVNLLMNDAVFLLDEALSNMAQLKQLLQSQESGEWEKLPPEERRQQMRHLAHIGMIARFDNILGRETIHTLEMLTSEITSIFCHPTMVDRIASMLNYLLLQLVGPNKKNLKVKDQKEYDFKPANLVFNICKIYINLSKNEAFTLAVSQDGRSYRPELFKLADDVLVRIGGVGILGDLDQFAKRVEEVANQKKHEEEVLSGAPDEFLDPIMSTLMTDPVILPSSKTVVDRQTIARHLLSDQTDPFNRSALTMDMIKSDTELRCKIEEWITQRKKENKAGISDRPEELE